MVFILPDAERVVKLTRYHLPVDIEADCDAVFNILKLDKKREGDTMQFVLLNSGWCGSKATENFSKKTRLILFKWWSPEYLPVISKFT